MKKFATTFAALALVLTVCGCSDDPRRQGKQEYIDLPNASDRFEGLPGEAKIFVDTKTGVEYLVWMYKEDIGEYTRSYNGITVLVDKDGKPLLSHKVG